jgi:hypothetical protein
VWKGREGGGSGGEEGCCGESGRVRSWERGWWGGGDDNVRQRCKPLQIASDLSSHSQFLLKLCVCVCCVCVLCVCVCVCVCVCTHLHAQTHQRAGGGETECVCVSICTSPNVSDPNHTHLERFIVSCMRRRSISLSIALCEGTAGSSLMRP